MAARFKTLKRAIGGGTLTAVALLFGAASVSGGEAGSASMLSGSRPNIVFIFTDDWGWGDLGCHGHPYVKTPHVDRLAREGTDFHRFTVASPVCSPSRTAIMTGHFPARYRIDGHFAWPKDNARRGMPDWLDPGAVLLPRLLQQAGYATAHFGKWHLANDMIPDSPLPAEYGYDEAAAFNCAGEQAPVHEDVPRAIAFIEASVDQGRPFFVNLWMHEPHTPFHVLPKYRWRFPELSEAENIYAATLAHADDRVGELLMALDRIGIREDTLVIFSSDNGPAHNFRSQSLGLMYDTATGAGFNIAASVGITAGRRGYKGSLYEGGIGVPFIVRWPRYVPAGRVDDHTFLSAVDVLPTLCELAGVTFPEDYIPDGISQVGALLEASAPHRAKPLFWTFPSAWPPDSRQPEHWATWAMLKGRWKVMASAAEEHVELYDLVSDPGESEDLSSRHPEVVSDMLDQLTHWRSSLPESPDSRFFSRERASK